MRVSHVAYAHGILVERDKVLNIWNLSVTISYIIVAKE